MARVALLLIAVFCAIQLSTAGRIVRDAPDADDLSKKVEDAWQTFTKQVEQTFTKENLDKLANEFKEFGDKVKAAGTDLMAKVEKKAEEVKN